MSQATTRPFRGAPGSVTSGVLYRYRSVRASLQRPLPAPRHGGVSHVQTTLGSAGAWNAGSTVNGSTMSRARSQGSGPQPVPYAGQVRSVGSHSTG